MSNEKMTTTEAVSTASERQETSLNEKKAWFRRTRPNGGMVLNPLRVTDQMAIFEARLFADTGDHNPLASFTAARSADKATGKQYIRAAQEDALNEALDNAGFGIAPCRDTVSVDAGPEPDAPQENGDAPEMQPVAVPETQLATVPEPPAPPEKAETPPAVLDIVTGKPVEAEKQPEPENVQESSAAETQESAPVTYTADMTVEEICKVMTLEQANGIVVRDGTCKGWSLEQVARDRPTSLKWFQVACPFADNVLKAASKIVLADLELKMAG